MKVYFSDIFKVAPSKIEKYGAFNISLINDLPLFIDPFLLFNSDKKGYKQLHKQILEYVKFLRDKSSDPGIREGLLWNWFIFSEVKQNWFGYSLIGNEGSGLGIDFARNLNRNLYQLFNNFGKEKISKSSHLEKLCLLKEGVGKDNISDFTTNLIKEYLLRYTEIFAKNNILPKYRKDFVVSKVRFNYKTESWVSGTFNLPSYNDDYVLLTPKDMLTKDETWINKNDVVNKFHDIVGAISNNQIRDLINSYFIANLPQAEKDKKGNIKKPTNKEIAKAVSLVLERYPEFIDYYIRYKEDNSAEATSVSKERVQETKELFITELTKLITTLQKQTKFYETPLDTLEETHKRVLFLKDVIENKDGYRIFYVKGEPIKRESDLKIMFRLTWYATTADISRETNEGRGPVDFKASKGAHDKTLVEFKLASNTKMKKNMHNQVDIYKKAHDTDKSIKVVLYFTEAEHEKVLSVLKELGLEKEKYIVLIDAGKDNKPSASIA